MLSAELHSDPARARDAARRFADALAAEALLDQTARLEATLAADGTVLDTWYPRPSLADTSPATGTRHLTPEEARAALPYWDAAQPWAKAIGAPELIAHLRGEISLSDARDAATLASRQYAKRQRTWFRSRMKAWRELALP